MIPALAIIGVGRKRTIPLPFPFFLLWPFILLAIALVWLADALAPRRSEARSALALAKVALLAMFHLSGLRIDVRSRSQESFWLWLL